MDKEKRMAEKHTAQRRKEDAELVRVLVWFGAAVAAELVLLLLNRYYISPHTGVEMDFQIALYTHFPLVIGVLALLTVAGAAWLIMRWKKGGSCLLPGAAAGVLLALLVSGIYTPMAFMRVVIMVLILLGLASIPGLQVVICSWRLWQLREQRVSVEEQGTFRDFTHGRPWIRESLLSWY